MMTFPTFQSTQKSEANGNGSDQKTEVDSSFLVKEIKNFNLLIIGDSRCGKTTFIKVLKDMGYRTVPELYRGTFEPMDERILICYNGEYLNLTIIDTPGFNEVPEAGEPRSNSDLNDLISKATKRNMTNLSLVLVVFNYTTNIIQSQLSSIQNTLSSLGGKFKENTAVLVTHAEDIREQDESKWRKEFEENKNMRVIRKFCKAGVLFTGALLHRETVDKIRESEYVRIQQDRICQFLDLLKKKNPIYLAEEDGSNVCSQLQINESISGCYNYLNKTVPELQDERDALARKLNHLKVIEKNIIECDDEDVAIVWKELSTSISTMDPKILAEISLDENLKQNVTKYEDTIATVKAKYVEVLKIESELRTLNSKADEFLAIYKSV